MSLRFERATWVAIPGGSPDFPGRLSVVVSPQIEGIGSATLSQLERFKRWTSYLETVKLSVRVDGSEVQSGGFSAPDGGLWGRIFGPELRVDLVDPEEELRKASEDPLPIPVAPPSAQGVAVIKSLYRSRLHEQLLGRPKSTALEDALRERTSKREIGNWRTYIGQLGDVGFDYLDNTDDDKAVPRNVARLMQFHEIFHSRPPMRVFPDLVRDERKREWTQEDLAYCSAERGELQPLPRLVDAPDGGVRSVASPAVAVLALAFMSDPVCGGGLGFRLRPGDRVYLTNAGGQWLCESTEVQVQDSDDGGILYARPVGETEGRATKVTFLLPSSPVEGFSVTLRCLGSPSASVLVEGKKLTIDEGRGRTLAWHSGAWRQTTENPLEFHRLAASLRAYPDLLRRLGLIIDLVIAPHVKLPARGKIRVVPVGKNTELDLCPYTEFETHAELQLFQPYARDPSLEKQLLRNSASRKRFRLIQLDADSALLKNLQQTRTKLLCDEKSEPSEKGPLTARGEPQKGGDLSTLRQVGLALCDLEAASDTTRALGKAVEATKALCAPTQATCAELASVAEDPTKAAVLLHAEDLLLGYRVDVLRRRSSGAEGPWRSLCERVGKYTIPRASDASEGELEEILSDAEGWVSIVADEVGDPKDPQKVLRQSQAIFRWDGWSLVAERPGRAFSETGSDISGAAESDPDAPVRAKFKPKAGSLERLRLGDRYSFRLRAVDLAGNSLSVRDANRLLLSTDDPRIFNSGCYERPEPLGAPVLIPMQQPKEGESNDQLVIRSAECTGHDREWLLLPPGAPPGFVELHGVLDGYDGKEAWEILRDHDNLTPTWNENSRGYDGAWLGQYWSALAGKLRRLPYLPDPLFQKVHFRQSGLAGRTFNVASLDLGGRKGERYPGKIQGRVLRLSAGRRPEVTETGRALEFCLPPGRIAKVEIASCPAEDELSKFGLLAWCKCDPGEERWPCDEVEPAGPAISIAEAALHKACCEGDLSLITPSREITLVHAVEKPLVPEGREHLGFVTEQIFRFGNSIQVTLESDSSAPAPSTGSVFGVKGTTWIDRPSAGKLDFRLEWTELLDIPSIPQVVEKPNAMQLFQTPVRLDSDDFVRFEADSSADCAPAPSPGGGGCVPRDSFPFEGKVRFDDTKHHKAELRFDATSRFVDCFSDPNLGGADSASKKRDLGGRFRRTSESITVHFPCRKAPDLPSPIYMVPTFRFSKSVEGKGVTTSRRGGLRIFLARDWFSSGPDEMLAIVFAPTKTQPLPQQIAPLVSAWGADPLWEPRDTPPYDRLALGLPLLPERPMLGDIQNIERQEPSLVGRIPIAPTDTSSPDDPKFIEVELDIAAFTPRLDKSKNLWYVDVDVQAPTYFPFLRLGLARFQPYAEDGCQLSGLVAAAFCQLVPDVDVSVVPGRRKCLEVTVLAPATPYKSEAVGEWRTQRWFEVLVVRKGLGSKGLTGQIPEGLEAIPLQPHGDGDGQAKWIGAVPVELLHRGDGLLVVERQGWKASEMEACERIVGCVPVLGSNED